MAKIIKVPCTGPGQHENEVGVDDIIGEDVVISGGPIATGRDLPAQHGGSWPQDDRREPLASNIALDRASGTAGDLL
jgi:hypothetical protein